MEKLTMTIRRTLNVWFPGKWKFFGFSIPVNWIKPKYSINIMRAVLKEEFLPEIKYEASLFITKSSIFEKDDFNNNVSFNLLKVHHRMPSEFIKSIRFKYFFNPLTKKTDSLKIQDNSTGLELHDILLPKSEQEAVKMTLEILNDN